VTAADLKQRRERLGLGQIELAAVLGVSQPTVAKWERGQHPVPVMAIRLLDCLQREARRAQQRRTSARKER
jgi:DNA-binding transcriptional regulator YiaG